MRSVASKPTWWAIAALVLAAAGTCRAAVWAKGGWMYRRTVVVPKFKPTRLPGTDVAVVTMPTGGLIKPDGSDIRVTTGAGKDLPHRVLMVGPGDQVRIAFAAFGGMETYHVYYGKDKPPPVTAKLDIKRGVLLETWEYPGGGINTLAQVQQVLKRARKLVGRDFRPTVFLGYNPFGSQHRLASVFTGWFVAPKSGAYTFSCSSRNASFLLVDDKVVVSYGGHHGPARDIRKRGSIQLRRGLRKLTFYHVSPSGDPIAVAAWQAPGDKRVWTIPASAFTPVARGMPGALRQYGKPLTIDFVPTHANEAFMKNRYFQRYTFRALWDGRMGSKATWTWDFGDGQTATGNAVEHVYILPGLYTVTMTSKVPGLPGLSGLKRTNRIFVSRPWDRVTRHDLDSIRRHADIVSAYDFSALGPEATAWAVDLFLRTGKKTSVVRAGAAFVARDEAPADNIRRIVPPFADALVARGMNVRAVASLQKAAKMTKDPSVCAEMLAKAGRICLLDRTKSAEALGLFTTVIKRYAALSRSVAIRDARMGIGDVWRSRGDYKRAAQAYGKAHTGRLGLGIKAPIVRGDFARHVEDYTRRGDFESARDFLARWEHTFPLDKLEGYWSLLAAKFYLAQNKTQDAIWEAETLVAVSPTSNYAAELLMLAAGVYKKTGNMDKYRACLKKVAEKYRESPLSIKAAQLLGGK